MQDSDSIFSNDKKNAIFVGAFSVQELSNLLVELLALAREGASSRHAIQRGDGMLNSGKPAISGARSALV